ncbi:MAG: hypothetical protein H6881_09345 [Rhodobiaceae bacterium]|nr:hypothetical protein [Rhodobiaceae bacterium]MCC0019040.1 hypothetical protein [Rhodobiaceae bacterium]MCC0052068.1 hypothetical protein [Rhodobiaceae bacterium]MCC0060930.1 hypothetical protein [Rhodobiaceae bacterium]
MTAASIAEYSCSLIGAGKLSDMGVLPCWTFIPQVAKPVGFFAHSVSIKGYQVVSRGRWMQFLDAMRAGFDSVKAIS